MRQLGAGRAGRRAGAGRALHSVRACAARERKDPRQFRDMDAARDYLHARDGAAFTIAGVLNWLSSRAFGQQTSQAPPWDLGRVYRWLTRPDQVRPPAAPQLSRQQLAAALAAAGVSEAAVEQLALLMLCSWPAAAKIALRHPHVLHMDSRQLVQRLLSLKSLLPECDVARLVEEAPSLYLAAGPAVEEQLGAALATLRRGLPGMCVDDMVQQMPDLPFHPGLDSGIRRLYELWPGIDEETLAESDPAEIGLAVKALSDAGPPRRLQ